jgi:hypothetical protein
MQNVAGVTLDTLPLDTLDVGHADPPSDRMLEAPAMVRVICLARYFGFTPRNSLSNSILRTII